MVGEPEIIAAQLNTALRRRRGVRAIALHTYARELALLLCPEVANGDRANAAEQLIRRACAAIGQPTGQVLEILCAFAPGSDWQTLSLRREKAGALLGQYGVQADTLRRSYIWDELMLELGIAIRGVMNSEQAPPVEPPNQEPAGDEGDEDNPAA
ncbi:hypothetical protein [Protofrankia symbiont of Coriaria ruscifolia]|uniref:hypothetical protein n=1 Tax=Protofrankia symbiont of Coriaria ruscifolia TaxID=1306542 RepID=UPI001040E3D9|nr:hypothetical protein [Protofrankia symbiont of Coriaria ruscifolia]